MNDERKTCYYCSEEKPATAIYKYDSKEGERLICSDCQNAGKH